MLTLELIETVCNQGRLGKALFPGLPARRTVYFSEKVRTLIAGPWPGMDRNLVARCIEARAWFEHFVDGRRITLKTKPKSKALMARLDPPGDEIWEARDLTSGQVSESLGAFAQRDVFIALTWAWRPDLRGRNSEEWPQALQEYQAAWSELFGSVRPMTGSYPHDYLTNAIHFD